MVPSIYKNYKYVPLEKTMSFNVNGKPVTVDIEARFNAAINLVMSKAQIGKCNVYFRSLPRKVALIDVINEGPIFLYYLAPAEGFGEDVVPLANTAGRDIGVNISYLANNDPGGLACTLIHELAHVAGATTDKYAPAPENIAAENSLKHCGCSKLFQKDSVGRIYRIETSLPSRYV
jgi:hypothetical protein